MIPFESEIKSAYYEGVNILRADVFSHQGRVVRRDPQPTIRSAEVLEACDLFDPVVDKPHPEDGGGLALWTAQEINRLPLSRD